MAEGRPAGPRIGVHLALGKGLRRAAGRAEAIGARTVQVFVDNPTAWKRRTAPPKGLDDFRERLGELDVRPVAVHASYLVNLAGPDPTFRELSIGVLASDFAAAAGYGAMLVNVHTGSHRGTSVSEGIERVAEAVAAVLARQEVGAAGHQGTPAAGRGAPAPRQVGPAPRQGAPAPRQGAPAPRQGAPAAPQGSAGQVGAAMLVLENAAGGGDSIGTTIEEHARIADAAARLGVADRQLGFCLDVAHAWGAGVDMGDPDAIDAWLAAFDRALGLDRLALIHCNDSRSERGSRTDRHEHLGAGRIGQRGFRHLLTHPQLEDVPFVLETPGMDDGYDLINLERAYALIAGEELAQLPSEAFEFKRRSTASAPADDDVDVGVRGKGQRKGQRALPGCRRATAGARTRR